MICLWLLMQSKAESWVAIGILLAIGVVLYGFEQKRL